MASKKKTPKKMVGGKKRKVGAVVIKRRGAKARLKSALRSAGNESHGGAEEKDRGGKGDQKMDVQGLRKRISRIRKRTKAIASRLAKPGSGGSRSE